MQKKSWPYIAAMLDAEGCISISSCRKFKRADGTFGRNTDCQISIFNTHKPLIDWIQHHFGGNLYYRAPVVMPSGSSRHGWHWTPPKGKQRELFLLGILPYLIIKKEQAKCALAYLRLDRKIDPSLRLALAAKCTFHNNNRLSPTTNMPDTPSVKIESELHGDMQSAPSVMATA